MEHPLINDISHLNVDELQTRIGELTKKLNWARRTNAHLASQIQMALETFQNQYRIKQEEIYEAARKSGKDYSNKIDIS